MLKIKKREYDYWSYAGIAILASKKGSSKKFIVDYSDKRLLGKVYSQLGVYPYKGVIKPEWAKYVKD